MGEAFRKPGTPAVAGPLLGAHMSVAGGLHRAFAAAEAVGCTCLQIFVKNQRQWTGKPLTADDVRRFREAARRTAVRPVLAHATYLVNLAAIDEGTARRSERTLVDELLRCEALGISGLVLHPGSHMGEGVDAGIRRIVQRLDAVHSATRGGRTRILLETTAGQGTSIGHTFGQLSRIIEGVRDAERLGVCLDTCHVFAAGYDLSRAEGYASMLADVELHLCGVHVDCIHVNDSQRECGSRVDRHAHIGKGRIGRMGFVRVMNDPRWAGVPKILETPKGFDGRGADLDAVNLRKLRRMIRTGP